MRAKGLYSFILTVLFGMQVAHAEPQNILDITPDSSVGSLDTPATVTACCDGAGSGAYCTELGGVTRFVVSISSSTVPCPNAGVQIEPGVNYSRCIVRGNFCKFPVGPGIPTKQLGIYGPRIVQVNIDGVKENLEYGWQAGATGWNMANGVAPSAWGFDGSHGLNFNVPGSYVEGDAVLAEPIEACTDITNPEDIAGKIALISRGSCQFGTKIMNAELAGAKAVIIINSVAADTPFTNFNMGAGVDGSSTILPAAIIHKEDGDEAVDAINAGQTVSFTIGNINTDDEFNDR